MAGALIEARESFKSCATQQCPSEMASQCTRWLVELRSEIPSVVVVVRDQNGKDRSDAKVSLDGKDLGRGWVGSAMEINPGKHELRVASEQWSEVQQTFIAAPGESRRLVVARVTDPTAEPRSAPKQAEPSAGPPVLGYTLLGVGVLALGASAALWLSAKSDLDGFESDCSPRCDPGEVDAAKRKAVFSDVALAVGLVGVASGSYLVLSNGPSESGDRAFSVAAHGRF